MHSQSLCRQPVSFAVPSESWLTQANFQAMRPFHPQASQSTPNSLHWQEVGLDDLIGPYQLYELDARRVQLYFPGSFVQGGLGKPIPYTSRKNITIVSSIWADLAVGSPPKMCAAKRTLTILRRYALCCLTLTPQIETVHCFPKKYE